MRVQRTLLLCVCLVIARVLHSRPETTHHPTNPHRLLNVEANARIKRLEDAGRQLHKILRRMVQHSYWEQFARTESQALGNGSITTAPRRTPSHAGSVGFSPQQLQELGELFGICRKDRTDDDGCTDGADQIPPIYRGLATQTRAPPPLNPDSDEEVKRDNDPDSPATSSALSSPSSGSGDDSALSSSLLSLSLVRTIVSPREAKLLRLTKQPSEATAASLCRISCDGTFVASATVGGNAVVVHSVAASHTGDKDPVATIRLLAPLRALSWITFSEKEEQVCLSNHVQWAASRTQRWLSIINLRLTSFAHSWVLWFQVLLFALVDGTLNTWGMAQQRLVSRLETASGGAWTHLVAAIGAPVCLHVTASSATTTSSSDGSKRRYDLRPPSLHEAHIVALGTASNAHELVHQASWSLGEDVACVACDATLSVFATGSQSGRIQVFDATLRHPVLTWRPSVSLTSGGPCGPLDTIALADAAVPIRALAFSPDGTSLLSISAFEARMITEWAWADEATAAGAADLTSNDSSDDGFAGDTDSSSQAARGAPRVVGSYVLGDDVASPAHRFELTFDPAGHQFLLTTRLGSRVVAVDVYKVSVCCHTS